MGWTLKQSLSCASAEAQVKSCTWLAAVPTKGLPMNNLPHLTSRRAGLLACATSIF